MADLEGKYRIHNIEIKVQEQWDRGNIYQWCGGNDFVIDTPPPTISGLLHIGHIFSYCHADFIARYQRMLGKDVFYPMGFDDNGLPTERLVEKKHKIRACSVPKEEFIQLCQNVSKVHREEFRNLFKRIGLSIDWNLEYHTISNDCVALSQMSFLDLYKKGEVYQKEQPMIWDPSDQTAIAQAEIEEREVSSYMYYLRFKSTDGIEFDVGTTRPELLPACIAVFVHPEDKRYQNLIEKLAITPLFEIQVPIIADENVKIEKGSGAVMCCTFGDELDIYWWKKYSLPMKKIINKYGKIDNLDKFIKNKKLITPLKGLRSKDARKQIIKLLSSYIKSKEGIIQQVKCAERSGSVLEILPTKQWFIKVIEHKENVLQKVRECNWYPEHRRVTIEQWIGSLKWDWCISRQRYFGIPFPVWYSKRAGEEGRVLLAEIDQLPVDPAKNLPIGYSRDEVMPELDVMDTWATSSISPQLNAKQINHDYKLSGKRAIFPATLRPQAHEIIRTWAFYTLVKSHLHCDLIPWKNLMISGWCLAEDKSKMSKSKGNVIEPNALIEKYGADVIRYWASNSSLGMDTVYSENIMRMGKRLTTKVWNAARFVSNFIIDDVKLELIQYPTDLWIVYRLNETIKFTTEKLDKYEYCEARAGLEGFFWNFYCDNYLELVKGRVYNQDAKGNESALHCISYTFNTILKLFAPFIPFITEQIYNNLYNTLSIHRKGNWPKVIKEIDRKYMYMGDEICNILSHIRAFKSSDNVSIKIPVEFVIETNCKKLVEFEYDIKSATNAKSMSWEEIGDLNNLNDDYSDTISKVVKYSYI